MKIPISYKIILFFLLWGGGGKVQGSMTKENEKKGGFSLFWYNK